jgi:hypothetical protein
MTMIGAAFGADIVEGVTFTALLYGTSRNFMPTKNGFLSQTFIVGNSTGAIALRYD